MIRGSCLCGRIAYTIAKPLQIIEHCHCSMCRKSHGAAFATDAFIMLENFEWVRGEEDLVHYESSKETYRCFCRVCGSRLVMKPQGWTDKIVVYLGTLDDDPEGRLPDRPENRVTRATRLAATVPDDALGNVVPLGAGRDRAQDRPEHKGTEACVGGRETGTRRERERDHG